MFGKGRNLIIVKYLLKTRLLALDQKKASGTENITEFQRK